MRLWDLIKDAFFGPPGGIAKSDLPAPLPPRSDTAPSPTHPIELDIYPPFKVLLEAVIAQCQERGWIVGIVGGVRTYAAQERLYAQGRTIPGDIVTNAHGGQSWHNFGLAADMVFKVNGKWSWDSKLPWAALGKIGQAQGLLWGAKGRGDDADPGFDKPHFQFKTKLSLKQCDALYRKGGISLVWKNL